MISRRIAFESTGHSSKVKGTVIYNLSVRVRHNDKHAAAMRRAIRHCPRTPNYGRPNLLDSASQTQQSKHPSSSHQRSLARVVTFQLA
jgi:hypothetical protein